MPHMHHWMANALITLDGDRASGIVAANCLFYDVQAGPVQVSGEYSDVLSRRNGRWAFDSRQFTTHFVTPLRGWAPVAGVERFGMQPNPPAAATPQ